MAKNANELLQGILTTVIKIEGKIGKESSKTESPSKSSLNISSNLSELAKVKGTTTKSFVSFMKDISELGKNSKNIDSFSVGITKISSALPALITSLDELSKLNNEKINKAVSSLRILNAAIADIGSTGETKNLAVAKKNVLSGIIPVITAIKQLEDISLIKFYKATFLLRRIKNLLNELNEPPKNVNTKNVIQSVSALPIIANNIDSFSKIKPNNIEKSIKTLKHLFDFVYKIGDKSNTTQVNRGLSNLTKISQVLEKIAKPLKEISNFFTFLGLGILAFAGSIVLSSMLLRLSKPSDIFTFIGVTVLSMVIMFGTLALADKYVSKGTNVVKDMGKGMGMLAIGIVGFAITMALVPLILGDSGGSIALSMLTISGIVVVMIGIFSAFGLAEKYVKKGTETIEQMGLGLLVLAGGIIGFSIVMALVPKILSVSSLGESMLVFGSVVLMMVGSFAILGLAENLVNKGSNVILNIGKSLLWLSGGIIAFALTMNVLPSILKTTDITSSMMTIGLIVGVTVGLFAFIGLSEKLVSKGSNVIKDMGIGMGILSLGVIAFALTMRLLPIIFKGESGGTIAGSLILMGLIVASIVGSFALIGTAESLIKKGAITVMIMSAGLVVLSMSIIALATAAKYLTGGSLSLGKESLSKGEKDQNKSAILNGLGTIGLIFLAATAAFSLLGIPAVALLVATGVGVSMLMSLSLIMFAFSVSKLAKASKDVAGLNMRDSISNMISGTIYGVLDGLSALTGGKSGIGAVAEFMKNSVKIFAGLAVLLAMSVTLSMFALAISAFAELENMRVINGYDKNGKPIFGEKINVRNVADNISFSIGTFLETLLSKTDKLTTDKAKALGRLGRSLTGNRGILSAIHDFADVLKAFAQFGPNGEIGYVEMVPDGTDKDGNAKFKQVAAKVKITNVASNIVDSFGSFVDQLVSRKSLFEVTGEKGKRMMELSEVLMGSESLKVFGLSFGRNKPGLLAPITKFSEIINTYASGNGKTIPLLDENGEKIKDVIIEDIASNIITGLITFTTKLGDAKVAVNTSNAEKNIGKFSDLMESTNKIASSLDNMSKLTTTVKDLAEGIGLLAINVDKLNADKLSKIIEKANSQTSNAIIANQKRAESEQTYIAAERKQSAMIQQKEPDWDNIAQMIGQTVGQQVAAVLKNGQFTFEFSHSKSNEGIFYLNH